MTLNCVTCKSFAWNKAGDFRTSILCMDKNKINAAHGGVYTRYIPPNKEILKLTKPQL